MKVERILNVVSAIICMAIAIALFLRTPTDNIFDRQLGLFECFWYGFILWVIFAIFIHVVVSIFSFFWEMNMDTEEKSENNGSIS